MSKRGRRPNQTGRSDGESRHVRLDYWLLEHPNFLALSANAKVAMIYVAKRFNGFNNGQIGFGCRAGCLMPIGGGQHIERGFGLSRPQIARALIELEAAGFIVCTKGATFDQKRLTREWRLTWLPSGLKGERAPTKEFARLPADQNLKASLAGETMRQIQSHQCDYEMEPISPFDAYSLTSVTIAKSHSLARETHLITMGSGGEIITLHRAKAE